MFESIGVVIIDEFPIVRLGIREILSERSKAHIMGEFASLQDASRFIRIQKPDLVITELVNGGRYMLEELPGFFSDHSVKALAFTDCSNWECVEKFLNAGGCGYASKQESVDELISAVNAVVCGRRWISPYINSPPEPVKDASPKKTIALSKREWEIISLVIKGLTSKEIAEQLCVSIKTVESHRYRVFKKLNIRHSAQLAKLIEKVSIK